MTEMSDIITNSSQKLNAYLSAVFEFFPESAEREFIKWYTWIWTVSIIERAKSACILLTAGNIISSRTVTRSLLEAYATLFWAIDGKTPEDIEVRFIALDKSYVNEFVSSYKYAMHNGIAFPSGTEENVKERQKTIEEELRKRGNPKLPSIPQLKDIINPSFYFSYKDLSDSTHPSSGMINDLFDLSQTDLAVGMSANPSRVGSILEAVYQAVRGTFEKAGPFLGVNWETFLEKTKESETSVKKHIDMLNS